MTQALWFCTQETIASTQQYIRSTETRYGVQLNVAIINASPNQYKQTPPSVHQYNVKHLPTLIINNRTYTGSAIQQALEAYAKHLVSGYQNTVQVSAGNFNYNRPQMPQVPQTHIPQTQTQTQAPTPGAPVYTNNALYNPQRVNTFQNNLHTTEQAQGANIHDDGINSAFTNAPAFSVQQINEMWDGRFTMPGEYDGSAENDKITAEQIVKQRAAEALASREGYRDQMRRVHPLGARLGNGGGGNSNPPPQHRPAAPALTNDDIQRMRQGYTQAR